MVFFEEKGWVFMKTLGLFEKIDGNFISSFVEKKANTHPSKALDDQIKLNLFRPYQ